MVPTLEKQNNIFSKSWTDKSESLNIWKNHANYENDVYTLPKHLDEKVAKLHLKHLGVELEDLSEDQAKYIGVKKSGPYKPDYYRY